ncbi:TPA: hypothetical protein DEP58_01760 [Patescibacteria group bacterium]|nr:hypothetical protein [Patescibacteria group bacterium]
MKTKQQIEEAIRSDTINEILEAISGMGIGGKGRYQDGFRDGIAFVTGGIEALLEEDVDHD